MRFVKWYPSVTEPDLGSVSALEVSSPLSFSDRGPGR